ncbi:ABC transporter permease [Aestuariivirga sp. YIM B02566]|uniref:ABC transporter permease subunit n=1 Tax=Taklimakanibacter albus TaxID=2800327 RepID=A0ACC5R2Q9_9HYPH|nr:ABC transporter permease subunit [Aestuariivirga sp. YIM B02566]MBK1866895.1 ABC transporter permease subunit [Aestuariivirga sp. YIM B02566]
MFIAASNWELLWQWKGNLLSGAISTLQISFLAYVFGLSLGLAGAMGKLTGGKVLKGILEVYTTVIRSLPELLLIVMLFYLGTDMLNRLMLTLGYEAMRINGFAAAVVVLGFVMGAYATEVLRGAIQAIPIGQIEAAKAYGMSPFLLFRRIILPAMLPYAIPGLSNLWLNITKDSALVAVVGYSELALQTKQAAGSTKAYFTFFVAAALLYLIISMTSLRIFGALENYVRRGQPKLG